MAKIRPAHRCAARRTDGQPCCNYAIVGGTVCMPHGGAAPQVRAAANDRLRLDDARRAMVAGVAAHTRAVTKWRTRRVLAAAATTGLDPVLLARSPAALAAIEVAHGLPSPPAPRPHRDRRFRANRAGFDGRA